MLNFQGFSYFCAKEGAVALADLIGQLCDSPLFYIMSLDPQIKTSKLSNFLLHQFEGIHKFWGAPFYRERIMISDYPISYISERLIQRIG